MLFLDRVNVFVSFLSSLPVTLKSIFFFCQAYRNNEKIMNSNEVELNFSELRAYEL